MAKSAMSGIWDCKGEPLFDFESGEWLLLKDEFNKKEVNDPSSKLTKSKTAEKILHDIEELGKEENDYWLEEFPLFEEIQSLDPFDELKPQCGHKVEDFTEKPNPEKASPKDVSVVADFPNQSTPVENLFSSALYENSTFFLSGENLLLIDSKPFLSITSLQPECLETIQYSEEEAKESDEERSSVGGHRPEVAPINPLDGKSDFKMEMAVVDEIIRNTALELDQWESDTSTSETSTDGLTSSEASPKGRIEDNDDPEWKPESSVSPGGGRRYHAKRSRSCWRGGSQEDKRQRKKEQNKNASTRYRQRKKAEVYEILKEEEALRERKAKLEEKVCDIQNEIKCLKGLMRDLFKAKGFIN